MTIDDGIYYNGTNSLDVPFGAVSMNEQISFTVAVDAKNCYLVLYKKGIKEAVDTISMERIAGNVYQILIDNSNLNADYYMYIADGVEFIDPYAKMLIGRNRFGYFTADDEKEPVRGCIKKERFSWEGDQPVFYRWADTILYKLHIRGFTKTADIPIKHRGTYLGIADMSEYFNELGVNTLLLMPCVEFDEIMEMKPERFGKPENIKLQENYKESEIYAKKEISKAVYNNIEGEEKYKINYWGYTKQYNYFSPKTSYASNHEVASIEFKQMVKVLHAHDISVIMEMEFVKAVPIKQMIDCLRYWAIEYHIDGFKLNTANDAILGDPWIADKKLIIPDFFEELEIYDAGKKLKRLAIYGDSFMYDARMFIKGDEYKTEAYINKTSKGEARTGIINYITDHNGFTLADLYSYEHKHNEDNGEDNKDGREHNFSWNCGVEGKSKKKDVSELRLKMRKNAITALILSQGTPMIYAGDEFGNSQNGNNNAYCQDNLIGWVDWKSKKGNEEFLSFTKQLISLRKRYTLFHYPAMLRKMDYISCGYPDITFHGRKAWYPDYSGQNRALGILLCGRYAKLVTKKEEEDIYIVYNMHWEPHVFDLPSMNPEQEWKLVLKTEGNEQGITSAFNSQSMDIKSEKKLIADKIIMADKIKTDKIKIDKIKTDKRIKTDKGMVRQYMIAPRSIAVFVSVLNSNLN